MTAPTNRASKVIVVAFIASAVLLWLPAGPRAADRGSPETDRAEEAETVTISFTGELTPLLLDEGGGGELATYGSITLDADCVVTDGTFNAAGSQLDDAVSLDGSSALTTATAAPTLFVNALVGSDVATVRAEPDGSVSGTGRIADADSGATTDDGEAEVAFYRIGGTWTSSGVLPPCVAGASEEQEPVAADPAPGEPAVPGQPRITAAMPGPASSGAVSIEFEAGDDWAPATAAPRNPGAVLGVQYRVDAGTWQPVQAPIGRSGVFTIWDLDPGVESRIEIRTTGIGGNSVPSEAVTLTAASGQHEPEEIELVAADCATVPLPAVEVDSIEISPALVASVTYSLGIPDGADADVVMDCMASLEWSLAGNGVPGALRHQPLGTAVGTRGSFEFSAFGLPAGEWDLTLDATSRGNPYAESTARGTFEVPGGPPAAETVLDCANSAPSVPSLTAAEQGPDGSYSVQFALSAPSGATAGDCTTSVTAFVPSAGIADEPLELDAAGGTFNIAADLSPGAHEVSIAAVNAADPRLPRAVGSALLAVPEPGSVEKLSLTYGLDHFVFATGATVRINPPAVLGAEDPAFAPLADLPVGMFLDPQTGALFGTAVRPTRGALSVPIQVSDSSGDSATVDLAIEVADPTEDFAAAGYPEGVWLPADEPVSITPVSEASAAGSFRASEHAMLVEPFSGTVLWRTPAVNGSDETDTSSTGADDGTGVGPGSDPRDDAPAPDAPVPEPQGDTPSGTGTEVDTSVFYTVAGTGEQGEALIRSTVFASGDPVPFTAAANGSCDAPGPIMYRSRRLRAGSSVGLLPKMPRAADASSFELHEGVLPPGVMLDASSGQLMGVASQSGDYEVSIAADLSNSTRRVADLSLEVEDAPESLAYPSFVPMVSGELFEAVPHIEGEEVEELLSVLCGVLPVGLRLDDRSGAIVGRVDTGGSDSGDRNDNDSGNDTDDDGEDDTESSGSLDPSAPGYLVIGADVDSEVVSASLVLAPGADGQAHLSYPSEVALLAGQPVEVTPSRTGLSEEVEFEVAAGSLPSGLRLRSDTGEVVGSATRSSEAVSVTIKASDSDGDPVAAGEIIVVVQELEENGSRWWWLWFVAGGVAVVGAALAELTRRLRGGAADRTPPG